MFDGCGEGIDTEERLSELAGDLVAGAGVALGATWERSCSDWQPPEPNFECACQLVTTTPNVPTTHSTPATPTTMATTTSALLGILRRKGQAWKSDSKIDITFYCSFVLLEPLFFVCVRVFQSKTSSSSANGTRSSPPVSTKELPQFI